MTVEPPNISYRPPIQGLSISETQDLGKQNRRLWSKAEGQGEGSSGGGTQD